MDHWLSTLPLKLTYFALGAVCGALIEIVIDEIWGSPLRDLIRDLARRRGRRGSQQAIQRPRSGHMFLGNEDTHMILIDGDGRDWYQMEHIRCEFEGELPVPVPYQKAVREVETRAKQAEARGQSAPWNGRMAAVTSFRIGREGEQEARTLRLRCKAAQYYHFLAINVPLCDEWLKNRSYLPTRASVLGSWNSWFDKVPPNAVCGLPVNLLVLTDDDFLLFGNRSTDVAIAPGVISCAINENLHAFKDRRIGRPELSIESLLMRAVQEEIGYSGDRHQLLEPPQPRLLAFTAHTGMCAHGLHGYVRLKATLNELEHMYQSRATDRWELVRSNPFFAVKRDVEAVCQWIHDRRLYDSVGVAAYLTLVCEGADPEAIHRCFRGLQGR